jgi:hypothetical protein
LTEEAEKAQQSGDGNRPRHKKIYWLLFDLVVGVVIILLILYRPGDYAPPRSVEGGQVSKYLTHQLMVDFYNGIQKQEPFELVVTQDGINDIIVHSNWSGEYQSTRLSRPCVLFEPGSVVFMATVDLRAAQFIVSAVLEPMINAEGLLVLNISAVKVGAMNLTIPAKMMAKKMYKKRLENYHIDRQDIRTKITGALFNDKPFEAVFEIDGRRMRTEKVTVGQGKLTVSLRPITQTQ